MRVGTPVAHDRARVSMVLIAGYVAQWHPPRGLAKMALRFRCACQVWLLWLPPVNIAACTLTLQHKLWQRDVGNMQHKVWQSCGRPRPCGARVVCTLQCLMTGCVCASIRICMIAHGGCAQVGWCDVQGLTLMARGKGGARAGARACRLHSQGVWAGVLLLVC